MKEEDREANWDDSYAFILEKDKNTPHATGCSAAGRAVYAAMAIYRKRACYFSKF